MGPVFYWRVGKKTPVRIDSKFRHTIYDSTKQNTQLISLADNLSFIFEYFMTYNVNTPSSTKEHKYMHIIRLT